MAQNPYVNKVVFGSVSIIDISDTTAVASDVAQGKYFYAATGEKLEGTAQGGGGAAITVTDTTDTHGGIIREITAVDISEDTVTAAHLESGYTAHDADGNAITGTLTPGITPTGTISITTNGTHDVTQYASASVQVPSSAPNIQALSVTQNGTYTASGGVDGYSPVTVNVSGGGGGGDMSDPIRFFDYDGTLVASYKTVPAALPSVPTHSGLKDGTWNYTLAQVTTQFNAMGTCDVGANYMTESEDTEIDVIMQEGRLDPILTIAVNGTVTVDWGDNTALDTATGSSLTTRKEVPHTYANAGSYTIKIHVVSGSFTFYGSTSYLILRKNTTGSQNRVYASCVKAVRLGGGITSIGTYAFCYCCALTSVSIPSGITSIGTYAFSYCYALASITIPSGVTSIGISAFQNCGALASVSIPSGVTSIGVSAFYSCNALAPVSIPSGVTNIGSSAFYNCYAFASITIPSGVTSIENSAFNNCHSLASVTLPSGVTSIGNTAFANCYGMAEYHVKPTTPPTLGTTPFNNIVSDCKIYVPSASLSDYQTAWSAYASYLVGE